MMLLYIGGLLTFDLQLVKKLATGIQKLVATVPSFNGLGLSQIMTGLHIGVMFLIQISNGIIDTFLSAQRRGFLQSLLIRIRGRPHILPLGIHILRWWLLL